MFVLDVFMEGSVDARVRGRFHCCRVIVWWQTCCFFLLKKNSPRDASFCSTLYILYSVKVRVEDCFPVFVQSNQTCGIKVPQEFFLGKFYTFSKTSQNTTYSSSINEKRRVCFLLLQHHLHPCLQQSSSSSGIVGHNSKEFVSSCSVKTRFFLGPMPTLGSKKITISDM